jgi:hypothetical protein
MFTPEPSIHFVPATRDQVVAIVEGINQPQVSIPGKAPQGVTGHLVGLRNANGTFSLFVGLHLPKSGENVIYLDPRRQLSADGYRAVQDEGLAFLESMGFMLDNLNFRNLGAEQQDATLKRIPLFRPPAAVPGPEAEAERESGRVARFLASV